MFSNVIIFILLSYISYNLYKSWNEFFSIIIFIIWLFVSLFSKIDWLLAIWIWLYLFYDITKNYEKNKEKIKEEINKKVEKEDYQEILNYLIS